MNSKTKYVLSWIIVVLTFFLTLDEVLNNFSRTYWLYASIYPNEYFEKDVIIYEDQTSGAGSGGRDMYYFNGTLKKFKKETRVFYNLKSMKELWKPVGFPEPRLEIPVWYCNLNGSIGIRTNDMPPKPYSPQLLNSQITVLMWILFLPAIIYIIRYQIQKRKSKSAIKNQNEN